MITLLHRGQSRRKENSLEIHNILGASQEKIEINYNSLYLANKDPSKIIHA